MCAGFERGTISTIRFRAKTTGLEQSLLVARLVGSARFAAANTSAGAPSLICAASAFEPPNEYLTEGSIFGNAFASEDAAKTVAFGAAVRAEAPAIRTMAAGTSAHRSRFTSPAPSRTSP